ncbi:MAG: FHA domain-containing protein [Nitrospirae bacterium]|nr:FHA domain-containing protein [Nitrospirota bacterium]
MNVACENCHTVYDLPEGREGMVGCPYCEHVNLPKRPRPAKPAAPLPEEDLLDHNKTMLGPMDGSVSNETTAVQRAVAGRTAGPSQNREASLTVLEGNEKGKRIVLTKSETTLGRTQADLIVTDPEASRRHCVLLLYGDLAVVKDMDSANGTKINDRVIKEGLLKTGDRLQIGATVFQFRSSSKNDPSAGPSGRNA